MLQVIQGLPEGVVALRAQGAVTSRDYDEVLEPRIQEALQRHAKIRFLYELGPDFEGYTTGAMWEDTKLGITRFTSFERIAVVSDDRFIRGTVKAFGWLIPGAVKIFHNAEEDAARAWICEGLGVGSHGVEDHGAEGLSGQDFAGGDFAVGDPEGDDLEDEEDRA